jgi:hypothetical protein
MTLKTVYASIGSDPSQDGITDKNSFLKSDPETHAVMYWGKQLLNHYYTNVQTLLPQANNQNFSDVILSTVAIDGISLRCAFNESDFSKCFKYGRYCQ